MFAQMSKSQPGCPCSVCDADTNRLQIDVSVDGSLRDRIAAAIQAVDDWRGVTDPAILADAAMKELGGLRQETVGLIHRYVTEWAFLEGVDDE